MPDRAIKLLLFLFVLACAAIPSRADPVVICVESDTGGCVAQIPTSSPALFVASDGESPFDPFGFGADTSDEIQLNSSWVPNNFNGAFNAGFWTEFGNFTWGLPASTPCGTENEPSCEPVAYFYDPGTQWLPGTPDTLWILDSSGALSDVILVNNEGPGGSAQIVFSSDPATSIPEPMSLVLLGTGLLGVVGLTRRKLMI